MSKIISFTNQKGGVGKSDLSVNLSAALAMSNNNVLLIDMDPQASASHYLTSTSYKKSMADVILEGKNIDDVIIPSCVENLKLAPATIGLGGAYLKLAADVNMQFKLRQAIKHMKKKFDYIIIDTPPSLGILTVNSFAASDGVVVPIQPNFFSLKGLSDLMDTMEQIQQVVNPRLELLGIVFCMFNKRTNLSKEVYKIVQDRFGDKLLATTIPLAVKVAEAPGHHKPILQYAPSHKVSESYRELSKEFVECIKN